MIKSMISSASKKNPLVSVIMPVYNAEAFLEDAIKSISNQTYKNFEMIIVDDASTDNSLCIIKRYKKKLPKKIKLITLKQRVNSAGEGASNIGISKASGSYIAKMDADDISHPERLEKQVRYLESHPDVYLVGTHAFIINNNNNIIGKRTVPIKHDDILKEFYLRCPIISPSIMFRRNPSSSFFYDLRFRYLNEYFTLFKLISSGKKIVNLPEVLYYYRVHGNNFIYSHIKERFKTNLEVKNTFIREFNYQPSPFHIASVYIQEMIIRLMPEKIVTSFFYKLGSVFHRM